MTDTQVGSYVIFAFGKTEREIAEKSYADATAIRIPLHSHRALADIDKFAGRLWIDPALDGCHHFLENPTVLKKLSGSHAGGRTNDWLSYFQSKCDAAELTKEAMLEQPNKTWVRKTIDKLMDGCMQYDPKWISVPQLPCSSHPTRNNKLNRELAIAAGKWNEHSKFQGDLILPVIFSHQSQLKGKTNWGPRLKQAMKCFEDSGAAGMWTVDATLDDWRGSLSYSKRFSSLVEIQEFVSTNLPSKAFSIAGPYWGMNLVLWASGTATFPACGIGGSYQYHIPGQPFSRSKIRVPLIPLRRLALATPQLHTWLNHAVKKIDSEESAHKSFQYLIERWHDLSTDETFAKRVIASAYKKWIDKIANVAPKGRDLALFQDLSTAYVLGRSLDDLPQSEAPARDPGQVAKLFMDNCL